MWECFLFRLRSEVGFEKNIISIDTASFELRLLTVLLNNSGSDWIELSHGFPIRTVLGPLLFIFYFIVRSIRRL